jgi:hypothetical protein
MADTIRLQSTQDPSIIIRGPANKPYDVRQWQPVGTPPAAASPPSAPVKAPQLIFTGGMNPVASAIAQDPLDKSAAVTPSQSKTSSRQRQGWRSPQPVSWRAAPWLVLRVRSSAGWRARP